MYFLKFSRQISPTLFICFVKTIFPGKLSFYSTLKIFFFWPSLNECQQLFNKLMGWRFSHILSVQSWIDVMVFISKEAKTNLTIIKTSLDFFYFFVWKINSHKRLRILWDRMPLHIHVEGIRIKYFFFTNVMISYVDERQRVTLRRTTKAYMNIRALRMCFFMIKI